MATKAIDAPQSGSGAKSYQRRIRKIFGNIHEISEMPNLIEVQRESYEQFLRSDPATGYVSGLEKTLRSVFPIVDFAGTAHLDFDRYELEPPKYDTDECRQRGLTYAAPMRVTLRLTTFEIDPDTGAVLQRLEMPAGVGVSGLESDGADLFYAGGGPSGKVRAVRRPRGCGAASG